MAPVALFGAAAIWFSRHKAPVQNSAPHLSFKLRAPTTFEALGGSTLFAVVKAENAREGWSAQLFPRLEIEKPEKTQILRMDDGNNWKEYGGIWRNNINNQEFGLDLSQIPAQYPLFFALERVEKPQPGQKGRPEKLSGRWKLDRSKIKAPNLKTMSKNPQVILVSCTAMAVNSNKTVDFDVFFVLNGARDDEKTPLEYHFSEKNGGLNMSGSSNTARPDSAWRRTLMFRAVKPFLAGESPIRRIEGMVSAGNRWPLNFRFAPFDVNKIKVGQKLRVVSFAAPLPTQKP